MMLHHKSRRIATHGIISRQSRPHPLPSSCKRKTVSSPVRTLHIQTDLWSSSFVVRRLSFIVRRWSLVVGRWSLVVGRWSFLVRRRGPTVNNNGGECQRRVRGEHRATVSRNARMPIDFSRQHLAALSCGWWNTDGLSSVAYVCVVVESVVRGATKQFSGDRQE